MAIIYERKKIAVSETENSELQQDTTKQQFILAVGGIGHFRTSGQDLPFNYRIGFADYHDVSRDLITALNPDIVMSPMLCGSFDCIDLAQTLHEIGFIGCYRIIVPHLPNPHIIATEIKSLCPGLEFSLSRSKGEAYSFLN